VPVNIVGKTATAWLLFGLSWLALSAAGVDWALHIVGVVFVFLGGCAYWISGAMYLRVLRTMPTRHGERAS
jgi:hypothetical protein